MVQVLGLDPGLKFTGYGLLACDGDSDTMTVLDYGAWQSIGEVPVLCVFRDALQTYLRAHPLITHLAIERLFFGAGRPTMVEVMELAGVLKLTALDMGLTVTHYPPHVIKATVSHAKADKKAVAEGVQRLLGLPTKPKPDHAADGLAIAYTHWQHIRYEYLPRA